MNRRQHIWHIWFASWIVSYLTFMAWGEHYATATAQQLSSQNLSSFASQAASSVRPLSPNKRLTQYTMNVWQAAQGLPQNAVQSLCQTRDGYLWVGTQEGLVRFDGVSMTLFDKTTTTALRDHYINALYEDHTGTLWIGTNKGLYSYRDGAMRGLFQADGLLSEHVNALTEDAVGTLWIGTNSGLLTLSGGRIHSATPAELASTAYNVSALLLDRAGALWIATNGNGLHRLQHGTVQHFTREQGLCANQVGGLLQDRMGTVWIGTDNGINLWMDGQLAAFSDNAKLPSKRVYSLLQDRAGSIWIATFGGGVVRWRQRQEQGEGQKQGQHNQTGTLETLSIREGLPVDVVQILREDREGSLWIGTVGGGLVQIRDARITAWSAREGLAYDVARTVIETRDGAIWVGTYGGGISRYEQSREVWTTFSTRDGLSNDIVYTLMEASDGAVWAGTINGLNRIQGHSCRRYSTKDGLPSVNVKALLQASDGAVWVGTWGGGVSRFKDGKFTSWSTKDGLAADVVTCLHEARDGAIWVGTWEGGMSSIRDGRVVTNINAKHGLSSDQVMAVREDGDGTMWIGTAGGGICRMKQGEIRAITTKQGLFDDVAMSLLEDDDGWLWVSTNKGIYRVKKHDLTAVADGAAQTLRCFSYGVADGMKNVECTGGPYPTACRSRDGRMWFPTIKGVIALAPKEFLQPSPPPQAMIEELRVDGAKVNASIHGTAAAVALPSDADKVEFHYIAASLIAAERIKFRFLLEGYDKDWVEAGTRRVAYYTNLPRGRQYRFRVQAASAEGIWGDAGEHHAVMTLSLTPHFYETWWFYVICGAGVVMSSVGAYRFRVRQLTLRTKRLEDLVEERTAEVMHQKEVLEQQSLEIQVTNTELHEANLQLQTAYKNVTILSDVGQKITSTLDLETVFNTIHHSINALMDASVFLVGVYDADNEELDMKFIIEGGRRLKPLRYSMQDTTRFAVICATRREEVIMNDIDVEYERYTPVRPQPAFGGEAASLVYLPLVVEDRLVGVLSVQSAEKNAYRKYHVDMLRALAPYSAAALDNARAYAEVERTKRLIESANNELQRKNFALEDLNNEKNALLGIVAHDLKNPLTNVTMTASLVLRNAEKMSREQLTDYMRRLEQTSQRMSTLVSQLLDVNALESGALTLLTEPFNLVDVARSVVEQFAVYAQEKDIRLHLEYPALVMAAADPYRTQEVIENLLSNAIKYSPNGKNVYIHINTTPLSAAVSLCSSCVYLSVRDEGPGFTEEDKQKLFGKFARLSAKPTGGESSTGLGLSIVKQMIEAMGGRVWCESTLGAGATFTIELPAHS